MQPTLEMAEAYSKDRIAAMIRMQIKLNDGTILEAIQVLGGSRFYQNAQRDCLEFVFDETHSMDVR